MKNEPLILTIPEETELKSRTRKRNTSAGEVRVAQLLLLLAEGRTYQQIQQRLSCTPTYIAQWKQRFLSEGLSGLHTRHRGRVPKVSTPRMEGRILSWTRRRPPDGSTHWSTRKLAKHLGVHHMMVARTWQKDGLKPHRLDRYLTSKDPDFEK